MSTVLIKLQADMQRRGKYVIGGQGRRQGAQEGVQGDVQQLACRGTGSWAAADDFLL